MSREIKRVPLDFNYPLKKVWHGYLNPYRGSRCPDCEGTGYSPEARELKEKWYGYSDSLPESIGNPLWEPTNEIIQSHIQRNGGGILEAIRLARLFNRAWKYNLDQDDVFALCVNDRLRNFTCKWVPGEGWQKKKWETKGFFCSTGKESVPQLSDEHHSAFCTEHQCEMILLEPDDVRLHVPLAKEVNVWAAQGKGHDDINASICIRAKCERLGVSRTCDRCDSIGRLWVSDETKELYNTWERTDPPTGEGWQVWETVSEGSPRSPVFESSEALVRWLVESGECSRDAAEKFVQSGWVPSCVAVGNTYYRNIESAILQNNQP
jgi:hypothetical protein